LIIAGLATFYSLLMIYSGGFKYILLSALIFFPATLIFYKARKDAGQQVFAKNELLLFALFAIGAVIALWALATGRITV
jgi:arginine:ornithine antiporter/lysine permease